MREFPALFCLTSPTLLCLPPGKSSQPSVSDHEFCLCPPGSCLPVAARSFTSVKDLCELPRFLPCVFLCLSGASTSLVSGLISWVYHACCLLLIGLSACSACLSWTELLPVQTKSLVTVPVYCLPARDFLIKTSELFIDSVPLCTAFGFIHHPSHLLFK